MGADSLTRQILRKHLAAGELQAGTPIALRVDQGRMHRHDPPARKKRDARVAN